MAGIKDDSLKGLKYMLMTFQVIGLLLGIVVFALCIWLKSDSGFSSWIDDLELDNYYIGVYIFLIAIIIYLIAVVVSIIATVNENATVLRVMSGIYLFEWLCSIIGAAVLLDHSTYDSKLQPMIRKSMLYLISESQWERRGQLLTLIQENIGCCGADGPRDYIAWKKPLPAECRDSVTGNAFFYGCVEELTWFVLDKSAWLSGIIMIMGLIFIMKTVMAYLLAKVIKERQY